MRWILLTALISVGLTASLQSSAGQSPTNLAGLVTVRGQIVGDSDRKRTPLLYCNYVRQSVFNDLGGPLIGTVVSPSVITMPQYICPVVRIADGMPFSYGNADQSVFG